MAGYHQHVSFEEAPSSPVHRKVRAGAFMGMVCDGYVIGIVGIALRYAAQPLGLTSFWMGLIGAGALFGILFGSLFTGPAADRFGRKPLYVSVMLASGLPTLYLRPRPARARPVSARDDHRL